MEAKLKRVKIVSDGKHTKVLFVDTGEEIPCVQRVKFEHQLYGRPIVHVEQLFSLDQFEIDADAPHGAQTLAEAKADVATFQREIGRTSS